MKTCKAKNCQNIVKVKGYCHKHYCHIKKYGKILKRTKYDKNEIIDCGNYCEVCIYNIKQKEVARVKIDKDDLNEVKKYKWCFYSKKYIGTSKNNKNIKLHQLILGKKEGLMIDHINHDKCDNRKQNLRHCTSGQNQMNKKNVKGYSWDKKQKKWQVSVSINGKTFHIGCFKDENNAIKARRKAEQKYYGEFVYREIIR